MRTLDDIIPPSRRRDELLTPNASTSPRRSKFPTIIVVASLLVIGLSVAALLYFSNAEVQITPNTVSVAVQNPFTATQSGGDLPYEVITAEKTALQSVKGSGTKSVESAASGQITISNTQAKAQKLIANTRFASADGHIFRIHTAITIPAGTPAKPGTTVATVYADKTGADYNLASTSFTIPGFAGTPQATQVTARSTGAMTGGASGTTGVVDQALEAETRAALVKALSKDLEESIVGKIPAGYVLVPGAATTTYEALPATSSETTGMVDVKEKGTVTAIVFPNIALAKSIAASVAGLGYQNEPVSLVSPTGLTLSAKIPEPSVTSLTFTLSGTAQLLYTVDPTRVAAAVSGKTRSAAKVALTNYPEIKLAVIILRPFWRQEFPQDPSSIKIVVKNPQ